MNKKNLNLKLVVITLFIILVTASAAQAMVKTGKMDNQNIKNDSSDPPVNTLDDPVYEWIDNFNDEQKIQSDMSFDYEIKSGVARIKSTYPIWTDSSFECMVPITIKNNVGETLNNYAVKVTISYDSDMDPDFKDIRFKHEDNPTQWLSYWIEDYTPSSEAIVWVNFPSLGTGQSKMYMFYNKDGAEDQSDFYSVFSEWEEEWANDEKVSIHASNEGAWDADVCYGNNKFLVVWEEGTAPYPPYTFFFKQDIRGSIYSTSGQVLYSDFTIRTGQDPQWHHENPSAAYGDGKWFVAWEHYGTSTDPSTMDIIGRVFSSPSGGSVPGPDISICNEQSIQADPNVCYNPNDNKFLVVWEDARSGTSNYDLYAKLYTTGGSQSGGEHVISDQANAQCEPWIAHDNINNNYMIVFEEGQTPANGPFDIWVGLFDSNLNCIGPNSGGYKCKKLTSSSSSTDYNFPAVGFCEENQRFLITYNDGDISGGDYWGNVWGVVLDQSGNTKVDTFMIRQGNFVRTDVASYLSTNFLVAFNGGGNIWGRFVSSEDGTIYNGDIKLSASTSAEADWVNMANNDNEVFVTWEDTRVYYAPPFNMLPDAYVNIWHLNIGGTGDITVTMGSEKNIILNAQVTSRQIVPENIYKWKEFTADFDGNVRFDILDADGDLITGYENINSGRDISNLNEDVIRLRAKFSRSNPSSSPTLNWWKLTYVGIDQEPPRTTIDHIDGTKGKNDYYIEESVIIWLHAADYPTQTGSGVETTYYTLDYGNKQEYNPDAGIQLTVSDTSQWWGEWTVTFWSVDKAGNVESHGDPEHRVNIKIDAEAPYIEITEPANEQQITQGEGFWVRAYASDNVQIEKVEFDIEPFGERPELPFEDFEPPYEWLCDIGPKAKSKDIGTLDDGVSVMLRAQVYDSSGQTWLHEIWVFIEDWGGGRRIKTIQNPILWLRSFNLGISIAETLEYNIPTPDNADSVKFEATKILSRKTTTLWDNDLNDGCSAVFNIPSGFYKLYTTIYSDEEPVGESVARVLYLSK